MHRLNPPFRWILLLIGFWLITGCNRFDQKAAKILENTDFNGGIIVHLGFESGKLTASLHADSGYIIHGLSRDKGAVDKARRYIKQQGLYGDVSVEQWNGDKLPYVSDMVDLVVAGKDIEISENEIMRVLSPNGVAYMQKNGEWVIRKKSRPKGMDDWPQYLYNSTNNAVSQDTLVGPPRRLQWVGNPKWTRHHDHMESMSALVSSGGRIFYIIDEGPTASVLLPSDWKLIARDAFNGTVLWKKDIDKWVHRLWRLKSGPAQLPRRLVANGDELFVTLSLDGPVKKLDAATGEIFYTYDQTAATEEIIYNDGILYLLVNPDFPTGMYADYQHNFYKYYRNQPTWKGKKRHVMAVDAETGESLWKEETIALPFTLIADDARVYFHNGRAVKAVDRTSGEKIWVSDSIARASKILSYFAPMMVVHDDVLLFAGGQKQVSNQGGGGYMKGEDRMTALSVETGEILWSCYHPPSGFRSPEDIFVMNDVVWLGNHTAGGADGKYVGRDLHTGKIVSEFEPNQSVYWFHHRCHRNKATQKYILTARTGIEYVDPQKEQWNLNHWVRGACIYGVMPANGLTYAPPHACACYPEAKLTGFNALKAAGSVEKVVPGHKPLVKGSAYHTNRKPAKGSVSNTDSWPTYRHDKARSGFTKTHVPDKLQTRWKTHLGGELTSLVMANNTVYVAEKHKHTLYALNASNGRERWHYTAGGRIDSPPTVYKGRVIFGSADGWVYCLQKDSGQLIWKFHAAPNSQKVMAHEQLESIWPVPGNVLVQDDQVWFVAGRSMFLNGGLYLYRLNAITGEQISLTRMDQINPETGDELQRAHTQLTMAVALPDILSADENYVYMRSQKFNQQGKRVEVDPIGNLYNHRELGNNRIKHLFLDSITDTQKERHLFCPYGFLDDSWFHRSYWVYGKYFLGGWNGYYMAGKYMPAGRILVHDEEKVYGYGRRQQYFKWTTPMEYQLFSTSKTLDIDTIIQKRTRKNKREQIGSEPMPYRWKNTIPLLVRGMVIADRTLFISGPPDFVDEEEIQKRFTDSMAQANLHKQLDALEGKEGGMLWAIDAENGSVLSQYRINSPPVWDGLIAADNKLFMASMDGSVVCWGK